MPPGPGPILRFPCHEKILWRTLKIFGRNSDFPNSRHECRGSVTVSERGLRRTKKKQRVPCAANTSSRMKKRKVDASNREWRQTIRYPMFSFLRIICYTVGDNMNLVLGEVTEAGM